MLNRSHDLGEVEGVKAESVIKERKREVQHGEVSTVAAVNRKDDVLEISVGNRHVERD